MIITTGRPVPQLSREGRGLYLRCTRRAAGKHPRQGPAPGLCGGSRLCVTKEGGSSSLSLSDLIAFESEVESEYNELSPEAKAEAIINKATKVLEMARETLTLQADRPSTERPPPPAGAHTSAPASPVAKRWGALSDGPDLTRYVLQGALDRMQEEQPKRSPRRGMEGGGDAGGLAGDGRRASEGTPPVWAQAYLGPSTPGVTPFLEVQRAPLSPSNNTLLPVEFAEPSLALPQSLSLRSEEEELLQKARRVELPPLQSVVELTTSYKPPERGGAAEELGSASISSGTTAVARQLPDGRGVLADGTRWEKLSGEDLGDNGYVRRWTLLRGVSQQGAVEWEEHWWEASDWAGLKELGAEKKGQAADGSSWKETWTERTFFISTTLEMAIERNAHKWAQDSAGDEWEEKWGEYYLAGGKVAKWADKWGKQGPNVWHERWGEDYDGRDGCVKWTDKWAERLLYGGAREQWGDKWCEEFSEGRGNKRGEVWSVAADGSRYQRWWGEDHLGDRRVRKHGHSTSGEHWDNVETMDTYYNPVPHFGFRHALHHSHTLSRIPLRPKTEEEGGGLGPGLDDL